MRTRQLRNRKTAPIVRLAANVALAVVTVTIAATPAANAARVGVSRHPVKAIAQQLKRHQRLTPP